jgi:hypothetical protein
MMNPITPSENGKLWGDLSLEEQAELLLIDDQSNDDSTLIMHESQIQKFGKWLRKENGRN